jgi:PAS domain S-box
MILKNNRTIYIIEGLFLTAVLLFAGILLYFGPVSVKKTSAFHSELLLKITKLNKDIDLVKSGVVKSIYYGSLKDSPLQKTHLKKVLNNLGLNLKKTDKQYKELDVFIKKNSDLLKNNRQIILYFNKSYFQWKNIGKPILKIIIKYPKYISSRISYKLFLKHTLYLCHLPTSNIIKDTKLYFKKLINIAIYAFIAVTFVIILFLILFFYYFNKSRKILLKNEQKFESMFNDQQSIGFVLDIESGGIINANNAAVSFYGYSKDELLNMDISRINVFTPALEQKKFRRIAAEKGSNYSIFKHRLKNGDIKTVEARISKFTAGDKPYLLAIINDITQEKALEEELNISHFYDPLTKLPNKNLFIISVNQYLSGREYKEKGLAASLAVIDFYKLSYFNNTYGYDTGDKLLQGFSKRLSEAMREGDIIARTGEDEFGILFADLQNKEDILQIINRLKEEFKNPLHVEERPASESAIENRKAMPEPFNVSFTMGISIFPDDGKKC